MVRTTQFAGPTLSEIAPSYRLHLRAENKAPRTQEVYLDSIARLQSYLSDQGMPLEVGKLTREHVEAFIDDQLTRFKPSTASIRFRALGTFWRWLVDEGEANTNIIAGMKPPTVPEVPVPVLTDDQILALLKVTEGRDFQDRRDHAAIRVLLDTGMRRAEFVGLRVEDIDWDQQVFHVVGKGRRPRACPFGARTARAVDRYVRARAQHRDAQLEDRLWLALRGPLTDNGLGQMLARRSAKAGLPRIHAHQFRHTAAHRWLAEGGNEVDLMRLHGWKSRQMVSRYGASAADQRAKEAHRRMALGDRL